MAIAEIEYVCSECGQTATRRVKKYNSREAREYEEWFKSQSEHICPDCYAKHKREEQLKELGEVLKDYTLPEIAGKSEKQVKYADDCRMKYLMASTDMVQDALKVYSSKGLTVNKGVGTLVDTMRKAFPDVKQSELLTVLFQNPALFYLIETDASSLISGAVILDNPTKYQAIRVRLMEEYKAMKGKRNG